MKKLFSFISMGKRALSILGLSLLKNSWRKRGKDIILHIIGKIGVNVII